ncbi:MAG TPA: hypothetical protein VIE67_00950 [Rudaea sp.]|jgi:hypothetical protein|uniref:hypothetical protein n=1 Tax=Rudaea sp. TaxID=2136325 RepID=UPI002F92DCCB
MRIRHHIATFAIVAVAAAAHAASGGIVLACPVERAPPLQDVAALLGTTTLQSTYNARDCVLHLANQACRRGALVVRVIAGPEPADTLVQRDALDIARGLPVR